MSNEKMSLRGFNSNNKICSLVHEQPYSDTLANSKHYGMPISFKASLQMKFRFYEYLSRQSPSNPLFDIQFVEFSKSSIFRILSQEKCEFIRFFFVIPQENNKDASIMMEGLDINGKAINEEGIRDALNSYCENTLDKDNETIDGTLVAGKPTPQIEERGNGGGNPPTSLAEEKAIKSFKELIEEFNKSNPELTADCKSFIVWMEHFYNKSSSYL